jgi:hypothetical protein
MFIGIEAAYITFCGSTGADHSTPFSAEVKKLVNLNIHPPPPMCLRVVAYTSISIWNTLTWAYH